MKKIDTQLKNLPDDPGIYLFYNTKKELIYVGKATSLRNRVSSYFRNPTLALPFGRGGNLRPIEQMIHEVSGIKWKVTDSVLEAIILEANYIKKYQPKYNVLGRDDKSWNYIVITKGEYPIVKTIRQHEGTGRDLSVQYIFGPYPGLNTKATMKLLRRMFFISTCKPPKHAHSQKDSSVSPQNNSKPCLYRQMGLCLGVCTREISSAEYKKKVIRPLVQFLRGGKKRLISTLNTRMKEAAKAEEFEEAARLRNQISSLERIHDIALLNRSFVDDGRQTTDDSAVSRIEGYDISNLGSTGKVGSMVVFDAGGPVKAEYRKFKIKTVEGQSDVDCLEEVLERRLLHADIRIAPCLPAGRNDVNMKEGSDKRSAAEFVKRGQSWPLPDIILIDGGKPQVGVAKKVLARYGVDIPIIGIAKGPTRKKNEFIFGSRERWFIRWVSEHQDLLVQVRDEAHRFAITYQRKVRKMRH